MGVGVGVGVHESDGVGALEGVNVAVGGAMAAPGILPSPIFRDGSQLN